MYADSLPRPVQIMIHHRHDQITNILGVVASDFEKQYKEKALEMKRLVHGYVQSLQAMIQGAMGGPAAGTAPLTATCKFEIHNGFPKLPMSFDPEDLAKNELEGVLREYLGHHYCKCWMFEGQWHELMSFCISYHISRSKSAGPVSTH